MLVNLRPSLEPYKVQTIWPVMVVDLSPYKLLVPPHCYGRAPEWRKRFTNSDFMGCSFQWATNV